MHFPAALEYLQDWPQMELSLWLRKSAVTKPQAWLTAKDSPRWQALTMFERMAH
jgi:hypothetical protein